MTPGQKLCIKNLFITIQESFDVKKKNFESCIFTAAKTKRKLFISKNVFKDFRGLYEF